jgi:hypothetical protein
MKAYINPLLMVLMLLLIAGCKTDEVRPPASITVQPMPGPAQSIADKIIDASISKASAAAMAAQRANADNPDGLAKSVVSGELNVVVANLPTPTTRDREDALVRIAAGLRGDLETAEAGWKSEIQEAVKAQAALAAAQEAASRERQANADKLASLQAQWTATFEQMKKDKEAAIQAERIKSEAETKRLIGYIFFGLSALCIVAGIACLTLCAGLPFVGPKVVAGLFVSAGCLSATGVLLIRAMNSPWIGRGVAIAAVVAVITFALAYANNHHAKNPEK